MAKWAFVAITLACLSFGSRAVACPVGDGEGAVRPPRPVVRNVSLEASAMLERASRLESAASSHEARARSLAQEADRLANRARILRDQATFVNVADRSSILAIADELAARAREDRARAAEDRAQASELRLEAQNLRQRALVLVRSGSGGGWRTRPLPLSNGSAPLPSERGVTL